MGQFIEKEIVNTTELQFKSPSRENDSPVFRFYTSWSAYISIQNRLLKL